jgi:hypothetical protein
MKYLSIYSISLLSLVMMIGSCSKEEEELVLDEGYLHVADALEYCQGSCNDMLDWEGAGIWVTGHVKGVDDDAVMQDYFTNNRFYLSDIRNGMFMEVRIEDDKEAIFAILYGINKTDRLFLKGTAEPVILNEGNECLKGVAITINSSLDINTNL